MVDTESWEGIQGMMKENHVDSKFFNAILNLFIRSQYNELSQFFAEAKKSGGVNTEKLLRYQGALMIHLDVTQMEVFAKK